MFITLEGPEGSGKSTQLIALGEYFRAQGVEVVLTREPGGTKIGEAIRNVLMNPAGAEMTPVTEALLMMAARAQHLAEVVRPALSRGDIVVSDRYMDSTLAYQGAGRQLAIADLETVQRFATNGLRPDLTILLDVPVDIGLYRKRASNTEMNRFDRDTISFHERVRKWFVSAAASDPDRWVQVDATLPPEEITKFIISVVNERLQRLQERVTAKVIE